MIGNDPKWVFKDRKQKSNDISRKKYCSFYRYKIPIFYDDLFIVSETNN